MVMCRIITLPGILLTSLLFAATIRAQWVQTNGPNAGPFSLFALMKGENGLMNVLAGSQGAMGGPLGDGIFRSTDSGSTWSPSNSGLTTYLISSFAAIDTVLFAGTDTNGIFRSTDNGDDWNQLSATCSERVLALAVSGRELFSVGGGGGVRRSSDYGNTWVAASTGLEDAYLLTIAVRDTTMYVGGGGGVFRSRDHGNSWTPSGTGLPASDTVEALALLGGEVFAGTTDGIYRLADTSTSWLPVNSGLSRRRILALVAVDSFLLTSTYSGGIFRSSDLGTTWVESTAGLGITEIPTLMFHDSTLFAGTQRALWPGNGAFYSADDGDHWESLRRTLPDQGVLCIATIAEENGDTSYYAGGDEFAYRSTDKGTTWTALARGPTKGSAFARMGHYLIVGCSGEGVFRTSDGGLTWSRSNPAWRDEANRITGFAVVDSVLFAATEDGLYYSTDTAATWIGSSLGVGHVLALALAPKEGGGVDIFAGATLWVYRSTDSGATWTNVSTGLPETWVTDFAVDNSVEHGTTLYASSYDGVFVSTNDGSTWTDVSAGLSNKIVESLALNGKYLFAGTRGNAVWRRPVAEMMTSARSDANTGPVDFELRQNYPNPFNPTTTVEFDLPRTSRVSIMVYDLLGREVARLVDGMKESGRHRLTFNGKDLATGVYLLRMQADSYVETRKIVLLR
jgi:photosystem II stability/assembly factor-like uncharacterized protein